MNDMWLVSTIFSGIVGTLLTWNVYSSAMRRRQVIRMHPAMWLLLAVSITFIGLMLWSSR